MVESRKKDADGVTKNGPQALSTAIAAAGVHTGEEFASLMSALMSDVIAGDISPDVANSACNAGGKLLKIVEMQYKYGQSQQASRAPLQLAP